MWQRLLSVFLVAFLSTSSVIASETDGAFKPGIDYQIVKAPAVAKDLESPTGKVNVIEFFSYGCPWCFHLEPVLQQWLKQQKHVHFQRIPVVFREQWLPLAKAYYVAQSAGLSGQVQDDLFREAQAGEGANLGSETALQSFFVKHGLPAEDFKKRYRFSPSLDVYLFRDRQLMQGFKVMGIPSLIVNNKYKVDLAMSQGKPQRLVAVLDYLVKRASQESNLK